MLTIIQRPNFFPGQLIDYRDFNRLAEQPDQLLGLLCRHYFQKGGIFVDALEEFRVVPLKGLSVLIKPGVAILPTGKLCVMSQESVVDLSAYVGGTTSHALVICLRNGLKGTDHYTDQADESITGFRTEAFEPEVVIAAGNPAEGSVELFRTRLEPVTGQLRMASSGEEWNVTLPSSNDTMEAVIDLRYRAPVIAATAVPYSLPEMIDLRKSLYEIEDCHRKLSKLYLVEDSFDTILYLAQLHSEVLARPFQPLKIAFLLSEFSEKMSLFLELLSKRASAARSNLDKDTLIKSLELLDPLRAKHVLPRNLRLGTITLLAERLRQLVRYAQEKFCLLNLVDEALLEIRTQVLEYEDKIILAGHLFERVDRIDQKDPSRYHLRAENLHVRMLSARYPSGDTSSRRGVFFRGSGTVTVDLTIQHSEKPAVILLHQYVRRTGTIVHYEINAKPIVSHELQGDSLSNRWVNTGLVVPPESIVPGANTLRIHVEKSDLDFGFFDVAVYQPAVDGGLNA
ncbi:MAG: hypothetical protein HY537_06700 [Deltaproteobacteria bacterium]|nr:hypothetical protein [Deltaproteobacteria bacterium]